jgi:hypothetical protein
LKIAKHKYELNPNSIIIDYLDKSVLNCEKAVKNMEQLLGIRVYRTNNEINRILESEEDKINDDNNGDKNLIDDTKNENENEQKKSGKKFDRAYIENILSLKKMEFSENKNEKTKLLLITPEYNLYKNCIQLLFDFFEDIGLHTMEKNVVSVQKVCT